MSATTTREKPILFRGEMVRAIIAGRKSMTRRVVKRTERGLVMLKRPYAANVRDVVGLVWTPAAGDVEQPMPPWKISELCPYGNIGDRLWVRETFSDPFHLDVEHKNFTGFYRATDSERQVKWKPSIFMPRWASRITLEITGVRVERLNDITSEDAIAEGIERNAEDQWKNYLKPKFGPSPVHSYRTLWESINGVGSWGANPWIWVIEFKRLNVKGGA